MFPNGVGKYVDLMEDLIPEMKDGTIRTAIDTGCGVSLAFFCVFIGVFYQGARKIAVCSNSATLIQSTAL